MKVLCHYTPCGPHYVRSGWGRVFAACGHDFRFWRPETKSAFDAFSEFEPDLFIGTTYGLDRALAKCIGQRPKMKVALFGSAWGPLADRVDQKAYPIVVATQPEKDAIWRLKAETGRPDFVFIHVTDKYLEGTMGGWRTAGVEPVGILNAADLFEYSGGKPRPEFATDVAFVGGYWAYKARNLDRYMLPLCYPESGRRGRLRVKIFGNQPWPVAQFLGLIDDTEVKDLFRSATVCPSVSEPHSTDLGWDVIERPFKVLAAGGFCVSDWVDEAREVFTEDELPMAEDAEEFHRLVRHFVSKPDERLPFMERGRAKVLLHHTYFERVAQMFTAMQLPERAAEVVAAKTKFLQGVK